MATNGWTEDAYGDCRPAILIVQDGYLVLTIINPTKELQQLVASVYFGRMPIAILADYLEENQGSLDISYGKYHFQLLLNSMRVVE